MELIPQTETLGRLMCIKEPSYSQRKKNVISYDVVFEKDSTMSQISISLTPDHFKIYMYCHILVNVLILMMQRNMTM